ncbi:kinesin family protein [Colletotrichum truncatum]|uniref:Kinesin family protein n=1 Tax=Colletotrichum truncatum TaxID=5467 RepID=A0ACC3Z7K4_COLTU|nr:kinesin family protein [Colletotrichum truncatum]KAF6782960.1 kinesin family protein [Colletotrichum truncatum]
MKTSNLFLIKPISPGRVPLEPTTRLSFSISPTCQGCCYLLSCQFLDWPTMSVRVVARIRPLLEKELDKDTIVRADSTEEGKHATLVKIPSPKNETEEFSFAFNSVYDQSTTQEELFTAEVAPHLKALFQGLDVTIFAYGVTGTGKTHTMRGGLKLADRGVIPRLLSGVYRRGKKIAKDTGGETTVDVALSYYEIYNDKVFDLFEPPEKRSASGLPLREKDGKTMVVGLSERACEDLQDFSKLYIEANNNRVTAATKLNAHSSRSHAILRVKVTQTTGDTIRESTASAIDLAGSEDNRRTDNGKERLIESAAINKSLFVLSQCIDAISRGDKRIPYRESKMTRILSLGQNNGITIMILNLAPIRSYHLDTLSSLNVSSRAKRIEVREIENEVVFKQVPRTNSGNSALTHRQPLRPLANVHNIHSGTIAAKEKEKEKDVTRPVKAFNVFADRHKPTAPIRPAANTTQLRKPAVVVDRELAPKVTKVTRPAQPAEQKLSISAEQLEALVEKKVSEILRSRESKTAEPAPAPAHPDVNEAVQRRLEALERRIENEERERDDTRSEGLRYLLAARQAKERGDDVGALKMYELALPFFPGQAKLLGKIQKLRAKVGNNVAAEFATSPGTRDRHEKKRRRISHESDDEFEQAEADEDMSFVDVGAKSRSRKANSTKVNKLIFPEPSGPASPRTQCLLSIVNSRDLDQIKSLHGFGSKKARDLVDHLEAMTTDDQGGAIESLAQLRTIPGMGGRTVDRAYDGLVSAV